MLIKVTKVLSNARIPIYASPGAMCFDLCTTEPGVVLPGMSYTFRTGLKMEIPSGYGVLLFSRSGHGFKHGTRLANCVGVIDSDYRGEIMVKLTNDSKDESLRINEGDRIVQGVLVFAPHAHFAEVQTLSSTARGDGGFGSTGTGDLKQHPACKGENCGSTDGINHSSECETEHDKTIGYGTPENERPVRVGLCIPGMATGNTKPEIRLPPLRLKADDSEGGHHD